MIRPARFAIAHGNDTVCGRAHRGRWPECDRYDRDRSTARPRRRHPDHCDPRQFIAIDNCRVCRVTIDKALVRSLPDDSGPSIIDIAETCGSGSKREPRLAE
jgi:hypothetical protein